jgi:hypothetical protein
VHASHEVVRVEVLWVHPGEDAARGHCYSTEARDAAALVQEALRSRRTRCINRAGIEWASNEET